ncbi:MAG TPA: hypothetical protein VGA00_01990 [Acidiferrobacterales bacterium]|jgi:hypothetical protein
MRRAGVVLAIGLGLASAGAAARVLQVGPSKPYTTPSAAAEKARNGDTVEIDAGVYPGDVAVWRQDRLTLRGVGGRAHLRADGRAAAGKAIWVIQGRDVTVENIEFSGAAVSDLNGAGIRHEGEGLAVRHCYFHDNENGILGGGGEVLIEHTEFAGNGHGDGYSHNIYIGEHTRRLTLRYSYSHHARIGHNVKSRAQENHIVYNRIMDETDGTSSYAIDLPDGGLSIVMGNLIQQGPQTDNSTIISYGAEGRRHRDARLFVVNNTIVNDRHDGVFLRVAAEAPPALLANNLLIGRGEPSTGPVERIGNVTGDSRAVRDRAAFDYRPAPRSAAIDAAAALDAPPGIGLVPTGEYRHPAGAAVRGRHDALDAGALEWLP